MFGIRPANTNTSLCKSWANSILKDVARQGLNDHANTISNHISNSIVFGMISLGMLLASANVMIMLIQEKRHRHHNKEKGLSRSHLLGAKRKTFRGTARLMGVRRLASISSLKRAKSKQK